MSDTFSYEDAAKPAQPIKDAAKPFSYEEATGETPARGLKGWGRDIAATAVKGAIAVPEALVGLADIPTGGAVGKFLENEGGAVGFRPKQAKEIVNEWHSDATKEAQRKFQEADGIVDKAATAIQNPSLIATAVGESLGPMGAGAVAARGLMAATRLGQMGAKGAALAGAAGEGATMAGSAAEQIRQETDDRLLTPTQAGIAAATGVAGAALGVGGAKLAQRLGVGDADTMLAQGMRGIARQNADEAAAAAANPLVQQQAAKSIPRSVIEGAISEGLFEELPQSVTEQMLQNIALGKDWYQDVDAAVVMGALSGGAMGGAAAGFRSATRPGETEARAPAPSPVPPAPGQLPQPGPVLGLPAPDRGVIEVASDGTARTPAYQAPGYVGDVTDVEPKAIDPVREQVATAAAQGGALSSAALTAIDTGAAAAVQPAEPEAALPAPISLEEADAHDRAAYEQFFASADAEPVVARYFENDDDIPDFDAASNVSDEDFLRALGATDEDIQDAIATTRQPASPQSSAAVDAGAQANEPTGTGQGAGADQAAQGQVAPRQPSNFTGTPTATMGQQGATARPGPGFGLKDALAQIRAKKQQEAANAQAATPEAAPATTTVSAARPSAVETAGPAADVKAITAKQIPDMTDAELQQAIAHYGPTHKRTAKLQKEVQRRAGAPSSATTEGTANVPQTAQAQQASPQPAQTGATPAAATGQAGPAAPAGTPEVRALSDGISVTPGKGLIKGKFLSSVDGDGTPGGPWTTEEDARNAALQWKKTKETRAIEAAEERNRKDAYLQKLRAGHTPSAQEVEGLGLRASGADLTYFIPRAADLFGITSREVRPLIADLIRVGHTDMGAKRESVNPMKALAQMARAGTNNTQGSTDGTTIENPGAQGTPAAGAQAQTQGAAPDLNDAGARWTRMTRLEREAVLKLAGWRTNAGGLNVIGKRLVMTSWGNMVAGTQDKVARAMDTRAEFGGNQVAATAQQAQAATEQQPEPELQSTETAYTLPSGSIGDEWRDSQKRSPEHPDFTPTPRQQRLMNEVKKALDGGAIYNNDVTDKVAKALGVSGEVLASNRTGVQGGDFGYDVYFARKAVEAQAQEADAAKIRAELNLRAGDKLGTLIFNDFKQTNSVEVVSIAEDGRRASFKGKRGAATVTFESLISNVKFAIERAHEKGKRKDSYEEFIAGRSANLQEGVAAAQDKAQQAQEATENVASNGAGQLMQAAQDSGKLVMVTVGDKTGAAPAQNQDAGNTQSPASAPASTQKPATKKKPSADQTRAKADLMAALADLGDILGKNTRMNIVPEQEQKLLPVLTRLLDAAFRLGYHKFKDAAKFSLDQIRQHLGADAAEALTLDHLQGAYIAMAGGKPGADTKRAVIDVETKAEIEAHEAVTAEDETSTMEPDGNQDEGKDDERTTVQVDGPQALGGVAAQEDGRVEGGRGAGAGAADGGAGGVRAGAGADAAGLPGARGRGGRAQGVRAAAAGGAGRGRLGGKGAARAGAAVPEADARLELSGEPAGAPNIPAANFQITEDTRLGQGGEVQKFNDNLAAIRALKQIEQENRRATPNEQALLARYVGWGGLANAFPDPMSGAFKDKWQARGEELRALLTDEEYKAARRSTRNAHYTSQTVVSAMWDAVRRLGYRGGLVLESSMGSGNFLGLAPKDMAHRFVGVEYDSLTARIGQALYPQATVLHAGFQKVPVPDNAFMLNIGNPPFGSESLRFQFKPELHGVSIHNQFFRAGMDALRPGGIQAMVVSRYLMDAQDKGTRLAMAKQARLVAAIRLPDTAFKENARTEVVTDILIFQKLEPGEQAAMAVAVEEYQKLHSKKKGADAEAAALVPAWVETAKLADPLGGEAMTVNAYFQANPKNVLGVMERSGSMQHGADITVRLDNPQELAVMLREAVERLPQNIQNVGQEVLDATAARHKSMSDALRIAVANEEDGALKFNPDGKLLRVIEREAPEGGYEFTYQEITELSPWHESLGQDAQGNWYTLEVVTGEDGKPLKALGKNGLPSKKNVYERKVYASLADVPQSMRLGALNLQRLTGLVKLRDLLKRQLVLETADAAKAVMEGNRKALAKAYEEFVKANGPVNRPTNMRLAMTMPDGGLVAALEVGYQPERTAAQAARSGLERQAEAATPAPVLRERVVPKYEPATKAATAADALAITLAERGRVDMERIAALLGVEQEQAAEQLQQGEPLVFQDPETQAWETADAYLSGQVKRKLNAARAAGMAQNVQALEKVIPEDWTAENVAVQMGATWVPADVYAAFLEHLTGGQAKVHFSQLTNSFSAAVNGVNPAKAGQWGTEDVSAEHIVGRILNSKAVTVTRTDSNGNSYVDKEATALAGLKAREIVAEFGDWVFKDGERRQRLVGIFNEKNNTRVMRQYNGQHLQLPGKVPDSILKMRRHQMNAIWRGIYERFMLVDHAVGAGKTFTAIARAMERRRMGLSRKPMIAVPNHLVEQWAADVYRLYPGAKVLAAGKKDFEAKRRRRLFGKIATGDWDIVIVPHSSFGFIGIAPETESRYLDLEMAQAQVAIEEAWEQAKEDGTDGGRRKPFNVKEAERLAEKIQARMDKLAEGVRDRLLTFEQLGVDDLTVDEAHEFKNLYYSSNLTGVRGMGDKSGSRKANDLYNKVRVLREQPTGSVTFLTGTPISNSAVEMFTMLRYLAADSLKEMGLEHFDAFRAQFVEATPAFEPTESSRLKEVTRLGRTWSNMRSLMNLYYQVTDAVSLQDIQRWYAEDNGGKPLPVPKVAGGKDRALIAIAPTPAQEIGLKEVLAGFDGLEGIEDPYERNAERLRLMDRARKLSLDIRAVDPRHASSEAGGKLQVVAENIKRIYDKWHADRGTQLVFLDRSVPKSKGDDKLLKEYDALVERRDKAAREGNQEGFDDAQEALDKYDANEIAELRAAQSSSWNAYQQIKDNLIASGIPAHEIRFVQEAANDEQKAALFDAVNGGKVRVLIGSTPRMGAGTNVQQRAVALHHVDVTWKPSDIEQREGRVIRQGNRLLEQYGQDFEVEILAYATERTVDAKMWDLNATKLRTINGIRKYDGAFTMEFEDADAVGMAEMAALASGNPLLLERVQLESAIGNLELQERAHRRKMWGIEDEVDRAEKVIARNPGLIAEARQRTEDVRERIAAVDKAAEGRAVTVEGRRFDKLREAFAAAEDAVKLQQGGNDKARYAITIDGERVSSKEAITDAIGAALGDVDTFEAAIDGKRTYQRTVAARDMAKSLNARTYEQDGNVVLPLGTLYGYELVADVDVATDKGERVKNLRLSLMNGERTVASADANEQPAQVVFTTTNIRAPLEKLVDAVRAASSGTNADFLERQLERARRDLPELRERQGQGFPKAEDLAQKRARLTEVVKELEGAAPAAAAEPVQAGAEASEAFFGASPTSNTGTATDRAIMDMVRTGEPVRDILGLIAESSGDPWRRELARRLLQSGANPSVRMERGALGEGAGFAFLAKYSRTWDELVMTPGAQRMAEQIFLHEMVHAATLKSLDRKGLHSLQMRRLFEHVQATGALSGHYGMKNVGEFVAEAFTNPKFQEALRQLPAPKGGMLQNAWDALVRIVRSIVGLPQRDQDALARALELGAEVMREDKALRARGVRGGGGDAHFGTDDLRDRATAAANAAGAAIKSVTVTSIKQKAGFKLTDYLGIGLQALGRRQIVDIYGDLLPLAEYNRLVQQMEADKNEGGAEADQLVTRWAKLSDETKLADLMHDATLAQIDPDKPYADGDDKAVYMMLQGRFKTLSDDAKAVYRATRDAYRAHHAKVRSAIKDRIERSEIKGERKAALLKQMDDEFFKAIKGVYFPLARFGQYAVTVKGPDGKVESVSRAETKAEAEALRNNLLAAFPREKGFTVGRVMLSKDFIADRDAVGRGFMTELYQVLDKQDMDAAQRAELEDTLGQLYLSSLPDLSWAKHGIHRKGTPGFSQDARRAYAQNMFHGARYLAKLRYSDLMQDELTTMQKHVDDWREVDDFDQNSAQRVVDEMNKRHESLMNPKSNALSTALTSLGFVFHLGLSPASAMVNLSQTALVAYPIMGAKWGFSKASAALLKASKQAAAGKNDITGSLNADERAAYDEAVRAGTIDVTMAHDLAGIAQGEDAGVMWKIRPVMRWASFLFHNAERFNRQVTFVAAYRLARDAGANHKVAFDQATKATYDGHFDYGAANRPRIMQGNVAKVLLLFKQYGQNMVYTLSRNAYQSIKGTDAEKAEARKALAGLLTSHAMAAGVLGLPMVTTLLAAASMIGGDDDEPWDAKVALQNMLADAFGQKPAEVLAHGLSRLTPWDISGRVGLDRLIFPDVQEGLEGQRLAESAMAAALGPVAGIGVNVLKGAQHMSEGRYAMGLEAMLPSALRAPVKALRYAEEGVQDKSGISILDEVSPAAVAGQALGFSPSAARNAQEGKSAILAHDRALGERRQELLTKIAGATMAKDEEAKAEARAEIRRFNEKNPGLRINPNHIMASVHNRQKRINQAQDGVYLPRNRREAMEAGRFATSE